MKKIAALLGFMLLCVPIIQNQKDPGYFYTEDGGRYKVKFNVVIDPMTRVQFPEISKGFEDAIKEWGKHLPLDLTINAISADPISIILNVQEEIKLGPLAIHETIGLWRPDMSAILLSAKLLKGNYEMAYQTSLHEFGHVFGLTHVVFEGDRNMTGYLIIEKTDEIPLMYPGIAGNERPKISQRDIELAREKIKILW